jgi:hypothetical protein
VHGFQDCGLPIPVLPRLRRRTTVLERLLVRPECERTPAIPAAGRPAAGHPDRRRTAVDDQSTDNRTGGSPTYDTVKA